MSFPALTTEKNAFLSEACSAASGLSGLLPPSSGVHLNSAWRNGCPHAETSLGYPQWVGGTAFLLFSLAMAVGRMGIGTLSTRLDSYTIMRVELWPLRRPVPRGFVLPCCPSRSLACILVGLTGSCLWPTMLAITADRYPNGGASMFGAFAAFGNAGGIFGALGQRTGRLFQPPLGAFYLRTRPALAPYRPHSQRKQNLQPWFSGGNTCG